VESEFVDLYFKPKIFLEFECGTSFM